MKNKVLKKNIFARQNYRQTFKKHGYEPISGEKMKDRKTK